VAYLLELLDLRSELFFAPAEFLLETPEQFIRLPFTESEIVVGQLRVLLLQFALNFVPASLEF
jgi:hypothetical protein